jgi:hypothetical protein
MNYSILSVTVLFVLLNVQCITKKPSSTNNQDQQKREEVILSEGYIKAKVVDLKGKDGCNLLLQNMANQELLNPVSWPEEVAYKKPGVMVYVKYRESRIQQSTCLSSKPIVIDEIKLIE